MPRRESLPGLVRRLSLFAVLMSPILACGEAPPPPALAKLTILLPPAPSSAPAVAAPGPPVLPSCPAERLPVITAGDSKPTARFVKPQIPANAAAPVTRYCDALRASAKRTLRGFPGPTDPLGQCYATKKGAWSIEVSNVRIPRVPGEENAVSSADWALAYVDAAGTVHRHGMSSDGPFVPPDGPVTPPKKRTPAPEARIEGALHSAARFGFGVSVAAVYDFDLDGIDEIILEASSWTFSTSVTRYAAYTFRDGDIWSWVNIDIPRVRGVVDVDHDGRPDLLFDSSFRVTMPCGDPNRNALDGPVEVGHALADGPFSSPDAAFSFDDDVARAAVRAICPGAPADPLVTLRDAADTTSVQGEPSIMNIACARFWGEPVSRTLARIDAQYPAEPREPKLGTDSYCTPRTLLESAARIEPPLSLLPRAAASAPCAPPVAPPLGGHATVAP